MEEMNEGILHLTQGNKDQFSTSTTTAPKMREFRMRVKINKGNISFV